MFKLHKQLALAAAVGLVGVAIATTPSQAQVAAAQCNVQVGNAFVPGLRVTIDGRVYMVTLGERGLRRSDLYSTTRIQAYVRRAFWTRERPVGVSMPCKSVSGGEHKPVILSPQTDPPDTDEPGTGEPDEPGPDQPEPDLPTGR